MENLNQVQELGFDVYLQNQFAATVTPYPTPFPNDTISDVQKIFFLNSIAGGDQLRLRTAMALNELWVGGADTTSDPLGYTNYMRTLDNDALYQLFERYDRRDAYSGYGQLPEYGQ
jgi:hypothetical protein